MKGLFRGFFCAVVLMCGLLCVACSGASVSKPNLSNLLNDVETYQIDEFSIEMQSGLKAVEDIDKKRVDVEYRSKDMLFAQRKDEKTSEIQQISLVGYTLACLNGVKTDKDMMSAIIVTDDCVYASYTVDINNTKNFYMVFTYESSNYFYCVNFVCTYKNKDIYEPAFKTWAQAVVINE